MTRCFIGIGANLGRSARNVLAALDALETIDRTRLVRASRLYRTAPWGRADQPEFINAVAEVESGLSAATLMAELLTLEHRLGRQRDGIRWGPRAIDLDMLLYGDEIIDTPGLQVPHPRMHERAFVLWPLAELAPGLEIPGRGPIEPLMAGLDDRQVQVLDNEADPGLEEDAG